MHGVREVGLNWEISEGLGGNDDGGDTVRLSLHFQDFLSCIYGVKFRNDAFAL